MSIKNSKSVNKSNGVNGSYGINKSDGVNWSEGVNWSDGVSVSDGVNVSTGVNVSDGINRSNGVNESYGINRSDGVNRSYGVLNSYGVSNAIFLADKKNSYSIFGVDVSKEDFNNVWNILHKKLNGWFPKFNTAFELYAKCSGEWKKVKANDICPKLKKWDDPYEAWKNMPKEAIDYLKTLPQFDADIFKKVTGIDVLNKTLVGSEVEVKVDGKIYKAKIVE